MVGRGRPKKRITTQHLGVHAVKKSKISQNVEIDLTRDSAVVAQPSQSMGLIMIGILTFYVLVSTNQILDFHIQVAANVRLFHV